MERSESKIVEIQKGFRKVIEVVALYMDEKNYYIGIEGDDLYPLPRKSFVEGKQEEFEKFIKEKTGKKMMYVPFQNGKINLQS